MKKLVVLFLILVNRVEALDNALQKNMHEQHDIYKKMIALQGATNGIWVPFLVKTGLKQDIDLCDIVKALVMTSLVKKVFAELEQQQATLAEYAQELKNDLGTRYRPALYSACAPTTGELLEHFCAGLLVPPLIHMSSKIALNEHFSALDFLVDSSVVIPLGTVFAYKTLFS